MTSSFGARLRAQREQQQISLTTIAEQSKIKLSLLEALERDDVSHWPLGIFGRSYIRAYAELVGLNPEATLRDFLESYPGTIEAAPATLAEARSLVDERSSRRPPPRIKFLIESAIEAIHSKRAEFGQRSTPAIDRPPVRTPVAAPPVEAIDVRETAPTPIEPVATLDFPYIAHLCTRLGCARDAEDVTAALEDASVTLDAAGVILWIPDALGVALTPVFAYGYSSEVIAQLPRVPADANNASADAFRTGTMSVVTGNDFRTGALVAPLLTATGCGGALAFELRHGAEQRDDVRAAVTILAAQLSAVVGVSVLAHIRSA